MTDSVLFLDDSIDRQKKFRSECPSAKIVSTAVEAIAALDNDEFLLVCLDHDLDEQITPSNTGMVVVDWIVLNLPKITTVIVHSLNYPAAVEMCKRLNAAGYNALKIPFINFKENNIPDSYI